MIDYLLLQRLGDPIPFGESVSFVCERGMAFEDDLYQESVEYMCQVGTLPQELQNTV